MINFTVRVKTVIQLKMKLNQNPISPYNINIRSNRQVTGKTKSSTGEF